MVFDKKQYNKEYPKTPKGKMSRKISEWKRKPKNGYELICENRDDYELIYFTWLNSERCEECNIKYIGTNDKCMDHCHDTGLFRNILCRSCNVNRRMDNTIGIPNIYKDNNGWRYQKNIKGKTHYKYSTDLEWLKKYKIEYEKNNIYIH